MAKTDRRATNQARRAARAGRTFTAAAPMNSARVTRPRRDNHGVHILSREVNMANSFARPVVVWLSDTDRERLAEIAQRVDAPTERLGGRLLSNALLLYTAGEVVEHHERKMTRRDGRPGRQNISPRSRKQ